MIASAQTLRLYKPVEPFEERTKFNGMTYGLGPAGYDIRIRDSWHIGSNVFILASSIERFKMPDNLLGIVHDKSTWIRKGLCVFNTVIEPGWEGYLTLELKNNSNEDVWINDGDPIAQVVFHKLDYATDIPYTGKYQHQEAGPQAARFDA